MEFIDLKAQYRALQPEIDANISRILSDAHFIGGAEVTELEEKLAAYVGRKHCVTCGNGTDALQLAYMAYGIGPGDAVFCPDMTFIASVEPACMLGASPVFCDIEPDTYNLSPASLEAHIQAVVKEMGLYLAEHNGNAVFRKLRFKLFSLSCRLVIHWNYPDYPHNMYKEKP